jgi:hypothetical protein
VKHLQAAIDNAEEVIPAYIKDDGDRNQWRAAWFESAINTAISNINYVIQKGYEEAD